MLCWRWNLCALLLLALCAPHIASDEACDPRGPCGCVFANGTGVDLAGAGAGGFLSAQEYSTRDGELEMHTYHYHPCTDLLYNVTDTSAINYCNVSVAICSHRVIMKQDGKTDNLSNGTTFKVTENTYEKLGNSIRTKFTSNGQAIEYENQPSYTLVLLVCSQSADSLQVTNVDDPSKIILSYYSQHACLRQIDVSTRSLGSTLLIILFTMIIFYMVLGVCTKKFLMGAQGLEVIPNLAFWMDLPNLCRDGWSFIRSGCQVQARSTAGPAASPDPNSYDSI